MFCAPAHGTSGSNSVTTHEEGAADEESATVGDGLGRGSGHVALCPIDPNEKPLVHVPLTLQTHGRVSVRRRWQSGADLPPEHHPVAALTGVHSDALPVQHKTPSPLLLRLLLVLRRCFRNTLQRK